MGLVYLKDELKMMLTGSTTSSLPHPHAVFDALSSLCSWSLELALAEATRKKKMFVYHPISLFITWRFEGTNFNGWKILWCLKSAFECMKLILSVLYQIVWELTLLLVMQTGDHIAVPKERDRTLTTPTESTVTGVPTSENLRWKRASNS